MSARFSYNLNRDISNSKVKVRETSKIVDKLTKVQERM